MVSILIAGDYSPKDRVATLIERVQAGKVLAGVTKLIKSVDYAVVNFETTVVTHVSKLITKAGPGMHCKKEAVTLLKEAGFSAVTLANNHFGDYGDDGVKNSLNALAENALDYFGGGMNVKEANATFIKRIAEVRVAFINVCEHEFSIATDKKAGAAPLDVIEVVRQIKEAKKKADSVVVIVHGGNEHFQLPSPRMKKTYRFFVENGADAIINHHQHCYSGYEEYEGKPIFYGLGNFCFDWNGRRDSAWNQGYMVELDLNEGEVSFKLHPYEQCNNEPVVTLMDGVATEGFERQIKELNSIIDNDEILEAHYAEFCHKRKSTILSPFTPYLSSYARIATVHNLLPRLIPKNKLLGQMNYIDCESHRDVLLRVLNEQIEKYNGK